jgi:hypothetical protein
MVPIFPVAPTTYPAHMHLPIIQHGVDLFFTCYWLSPFVLHRDCNLPHTDCLVSDVMLEVVRIFLSLILRTPNRSQQLNPASTTPLRILILSFDHLVL